MNTESHTISECSIFLLCFHPCNILAQASQNRPKPALEILGLAMAHLARAPVTQNRCPLCGYRLSPQVEDPHCLREIGTFTEYCINRFCPYGPRTAQRWERLTLGAVLRWLGLGGLTLRDFRAVWNGVQALRDDAAERGAGP